MSPSQQQAFLSSLTSPEKAALNFHWPFWARDDQLEPEGAWQTWLVLAGRGWGKTRTGAETIRDWVEKGRAKRIALVAETAADARDVLVEGPSGLLSISPDWCRPIYEPSKRRLTWPNGAVATTYSGEKPDQLRGPQHDAAWADELAKWRYPDAWDQLQFGLREGNDPRVIVTTTPRPIKVIKEIIADATSIVTRGATYDNRANLAPTFLSKIIARYEGTRLGRQEINAEVLDDVPGALWTRDVIDECRTKKAPQLRRVVVAVDPASKGSGEDQSEHGIVVCGIGEDNHGYVLADYSLHGSPENVARRVVDVFDEHACDAVIVEINNGGDWIPALLKTVRPLLNIRKVHASRGKMTRAEPFSALYEQQRVHHIGQLAQLEDQMVEFTPEGLADGAPADRVDALVWALTSLFPDVILPIGPAPDMGTDFGPRVFE